MYRLHNTKQGYSLIEVLVSVSILLIAIVGPMTIAATGLKNVQFAREQNQAFFIAQEGLEKMSQRRNEFVLANLSGGDSWSDWVTEVTASDDCGNAAGCSFSLLATTPIVCDPSETCDVYQETVSGRTIYSHENDSLFSSPEITPFSRRVIVSEVGASETVLVRSIVDWESVSGGQSETVELHTYLHNIYDL